jgi:putative FmdB family regulatory protein
MPVYEYVCEACDRKFEIVLSIHEHDEAKIVCPVCKSDKVHQLAAAFTAVTSKKS